MYDPRNEVTGSRHQPEEKALPHVSPEKVERDIAVKDAALHLKIYRREDRPVDITSLDREDLKSTLQEASDNAVVSSYRQQGTETLEKFMVEDFAPFHEHLSQQLSLTDDTKTARHIAELQREMSDHLTKTIRNDSAYARQICADNEALEATNLLKLRVFKPFGLDEATHSPHPSAFGFTYNNTDYVIDPRSDNLIQTREAFLKQHPPGNDWA